MKHDTCDTHYYHNQISMVVADGLVPIWRQVTSTIALGPVGVCQECPT